MMMVPRSFVQNPLAQRQTADFNEKRSLSPRKSIDTRSQSASPPDVSQAYSQQSPEVSYKPTSEPVKIPSRNARRVSVQTERPGPTAIQRPVASSLSQDRPLRKKETVQDILSSTTIPIRRKPKARPAQRLPNCDYVADFSKLLREDVQSPNDTTLSNSWTNPHFEGLFGNIDGFIDGPMVVGSESLDHSILSARSISSESMPSLASPDDFSSTEMPSVSPATLRSPSDHRLRQIASSVDCSNQHPLLPQSEDLRPSGASSPELTIPPPSKPRQREILQQKRPSSFKSSLTASLKALKSAAQTVSNIATTPPLLQPDEFLGASIFDFKPALTDDRRPPPSNAPPSAAMRRYLNPRATMAADSPAQLHFWLDEKPASPSVLLKDAKAKLKVKKRSHNQGANASKAKGSRNRTAQLPPVVQLATCIPSTIRTANASSPPTWLEPDGTPSNKHRAAQALTDGTGDLLITEGQPRPREPRENRDFLRIYVCELNMRKGGKLAEEALGHAKLWLPPVVDEKDKKESQGAKKTGEARWTSWTSDDL